MPQIEFRENKILKLTNVLSRKVLEKELFNCKYGVADWAVMPQD